MEMVLLPVTTRLTVPCENESPTLPTQRQSIIHHIIFRGQATAGELRGTQ
jgi:hypothetical protein